MRIYEFVREHIVPFNSVIAMSLTVAAVLDFLAPKAPYLAWVSYALATLVLVAMALEVRYQHARAVMGNPGYAHLLNRLRRPPGPLWKSPAWQVAGVIVAVALVLGQASKARADNGGLIASAAPNLRNVQVLLLGLKEDTQRIQATLERVDTKVDSVHASIQESSQKISALDANVGLLKKEVSDDPRKELIARGYTIDADGLISAIRQKDGAAIESFNASGYSYRTPVYFENYRVRDQYESLMQELFDDVAFSIKIDPKTLSVPKDDWRFCAASMDFVKTWAYRVVNDEKNNDADTNEALKNMLALMDHYCGKDRLLSIIAEQRKDANEREKSLKELESYTGKVLGKGTFTTEAKASDWMLKKIQ